MIIFHLVTLLMQRLISDRIGSLSSKCIPLLYPPPKGLFQAQMLVALEIDSAKNSSVYVILHCLINKMRKSQQYRTQKKSSCCNIGDETTSNKQVWPTNTKSHKPLGLHPNSIGKAVDVAHSSGAISTSLRFSNYPQMPNM